MIERIELGTVNKGAVLFSDDNINPTFRAPVQTETREIICFVKIISLNESIIECICSMLGRKIGLPIPKPYLVKVLPGILPIPNDQPLITYASEDAGFPSFKRYLNSMTESILITRLLNSKLSMSVGLFDEWIANIDRNLGNILYDGSETFLFIDHGKALSEELSAAELQEQNILVDLFSKCCSDFGIRTQAMDPSQSR